MKVWSWRNAIQQAKLEPITKLVLFNLSCHMSDAGENCYPSIPLQASATSLSERSVYNHLLKAEEAGFISISKHGFAGRKWAHNQYQPLFPKGFDFPSRDEPRSGLRGSQGVNVVQGRGESDDIRGVHHVHPNSSKRINTLNSSGGSPVDNSVFRIENLISDEGRDRARGNAPGLDLYVLMRKYDQLVLIGKFERPANPDRAFAAWCKLEAKRGKRG